MHRFFKKCHFSLINLIYPSIQRVENSKKKNKRFCWKELCNIKMIIFGIFALQIFHFQIILGGEGGKTSESDQLGSNQNNVQAS